MIQSMETQIWSINTKMKFELCRRSYSAAIGFLLVSSILFVFPLPVSDAYRLPFRALCVLLFLTSAVRLKHSLMIKAKGLAHFSKQYPFHVFLYCLTPVIYSAMLIVTFIDPAITQGPLFIAHLSIVSLAAASASSAAFVPRIQIWFLAMVVVIPVTFMAYIHLKTDLALQIVPAMMTAFIFFVFGNSQNFYRGMTKRFEMENALILQKDHLERTFKILEETKTEALAQKARADYSSKMASLGQMAGGVAHEVNTPLGIIRLYSDAIRIELEKAQPDTNRLNYCAEKIQGTTDRIAKIIRGLLSFSREGSKDPFENFCIHENIEQTLSFCRERFRAGGIDFEVENLSSVEIEGRPVQISQVVLNLLNNSYDAVKDQKNPRIKLSMQDLKTHVQIAVEDNGKGIDTETQEKLFQPFFTTKKVGQGTGLGLSVSHGIIKDHGGILQLDSDSVNTRFIFTLPKITASFEQLTQKEISSNVSTFL